jgi:hypothetical protein
MEAIKSYIKNFSNVEDPKKELKENNISVENEIIYDEIFYDGNSDNYDMILNFNSFEQLKKDCWTANFSKEG